MTRWARRLLITVLILAGIVSYWTADLGQTVGSESLPEADKVLIIGVPRLSLDDIDPQTMPNLHRLSEQGVIGAMRVKTAALRPDAAEAYASLGAGAILASGSSGSTAVDAHETLNGLRADRAQELRVGHDVTGSVVLPGVPAMQSDSSGTATDVGALGVALAESRHGVAVVANSSIHAADGRVVRRAPAALAVTDPDGLVADGTVGMGLLRNDPAAPFGLGVDRAAFRGSVLDALERADVVVADPGETERAIDYRAEQSKARQQSTQRGALARTDAIIGDLARGVDPGTLVLVVGVTPSASPYGMSPLVAFGDGLEQGELASPSTHRSGIVTLTDLAPSVLAVLGVDVPPTMHGTALRITPGRPTWESLTVLDQMLTARSESLPAMRMTLIVVSVVVFLGALFLLRRRRPGPRGRRALEVAALSCAAWPLVTFLLRFSTATSSLGYWSIPVSWAVAVAIGLLVQPLRRSALDPLIVICGATFTLITVDLATGGHLVLGSFFGSAPNVGFRYFGTDNAVFAILATCSIILCAGLMDRHHDGRSDPDDRRGRLWLVVTVAAIAVLVDGAPWMGADVGGVLTLVPVLGVLVWVLAGRALRWRYVVVAVAAALVVLVAAVGFDALRPADERTHIGRFFLETGQGDLDLLRSTIAEKWNNSMAVLWQSNWSWAVPIVAIYALYVLVVAKGWTNLLPARTPRRAAVTAALVLGVVGWLLNDSGILVTALVFVYLGPFLILIEVRDGPRSGTRREASASRPREVTL